MRLPIAHIPPSWVVTILSASFVIPTIAVSPAATLFNFPTGSDKGNCAGVNLDGVIMEASQIAQAAITAINNYQQQSMGKPPAPGVANTYDASFTMFGVTGNRIPLVNRLSISTSGSAILDKVKKNYQNVIDLLNSNSILANGKATLACDENFLIFATKYQDISPGLAGTDVGQTSLVDDYRAKNVPLADDVKGFYYAKFKGNNIMLSDVVNKKDGSPGGGLCSDTTTKAYTWPKYFFILLCPSFAQLPSSLAGVVANQGGIAKGTNIETYLSQPGAFLHEMMHFLDSNTGTGTKIVDEKIPTRDGKGAVAYGWERCAILGTNDELKSQSLTNADNYHYFGIASYLGSVNFGTDGNVQKRSYSVHERAYPVQKRAYL